LTPVKLPGIRAKRYTFENVQALARQIAAGELK
jgi:hypothetical protein